MPDVEESASSLPWLSPTPGGVGTLTSWTTAEGQPRLASSGTDGTIEIWDPARGVRVGAPLVQHTATVLGMAAWAGPAGRLLASASEDGTVCVWDVGVTPVGVRQLPGHGGWVQAVCFWGGEGRRPRLACAGDDGVLRIWDPLDGERVAELPLGRARVAGLASYRGGEGPRLVVANSDGEIGIWDLAAGAEVGSSMTHEGGLWSLAVWTGRDGTVRLASGGYDGVIRVWDPETGEPAGEPLRGHTSWVSSIVAMPGGDRSAALVSAGTDGTVRLWDIRSGRSMELPFAGGPGSTALPTVAAWAGPGRRARISVAGEGGAIRSYDVATGELVSSVRVSHRAGVWALASWPGPGGTRLARGGDDALVRVWNADTGQAVGEPLSGHTAAIWALVAWSGAQGRPLLASSGDDGTIRVWSGVDGAPVGEPLRGHDGWVPALAKWTRADGSTALVSAGVDGTIRLWDPERGLQLGEPLRGHTGWVMTVEVWRTGEGYRLASGGDDGSIRIWDPETGAPAGPTWSAHNGWTRALAAWRDGDRTVLVSGGYDGMVRLWEPETGEQIGTALPADGRRVGALTAWTSAAGARFASAGSDGVIKVWDLATLSPVGEGLSGHVAGIWALESWVDRAGAVRLASAGHDGSVRLWEPETGRAIRTIEIGPVGIWGISDAPMRTDVIGRQALADAIADQISRPPGGPASIRGDGPTVVSIEGPWGCGKSTLMNLVRSRLPAPPPKPSGTSPDPRRMTVYEALREIRRWQPPAGRPAPRAETAMVTAWFNPWAYQSGEQVWAGLVAEIIDSAAPVLYPTEARRERYWLRRNLDRIDRFALRRHLQQRSRSPLLGLGMWALVSSIVLAVVSLDQDVALGRVRVNPLVVALAVAAAAVVAGGLHTVWRRWFGRAAGYLPGELLTGPVVDVAGPLGGRPSDVDADPLRRARTGALYLHQHDIGDLVDDLAAAGCGLVVFVDDVDRCRPGTIAEVFEAVNLFLSNVATGSGLRAHFVVGLDSAVVASHLDEAYGDPADPMLGLYGDDPTPGWAFLRKLIQLPVLVPEVTDEGIHRLVDAMTERPAETSPGSAARPISPAAGRAREESTRAAPVASATRPRSPRRRTPVETITWRSAETHPEIHDLLVRRLSEQPHRSIREAKRLVNVWQFYERVMEEVDPLPHPDEVITRARRLLIVAEIVTRWPALQRSLHRHVDGRTRLQRLAAAAGDDDEWRWTLGRLGMVSTNRSATDALRDLLARYDGTAVADLAARLM